MALNSDSPASTSLVLRLQENTTTVGFLFVCLLVLTGSPIVSDENDFELPATPSPSEC